MAIDITFNCDDANAKQEKKEEKKNTVEWLTRCWCKIKKNIHKITWKSGNGK